MWLRSLKASRRDSMPELSSPGLARERPFGYGYPSRDPPGKSDTDSIGRQSMAGESRESGRRRPMLVFVINSHRESAFDPKIHAASGRKCEIASVPNVVRIVHDASACQQFRIRNNGAMVKRAPVTETGQVVRARLPGGLLEAKPAGFCFAAPMRGSIEIPHKRRCRPGGRLRNPFGNWSIQRLPTRQGHRIWPLEPSAHAKKLPELRTSQRAMQEARVGILREIDRRRPHEPNCVASIFLRRHKQEGASAANVTGMIAIG